MQKRGPKQNRLHPRLRSEHSGGHSVPEAQGGGRAGRFGSLVAQPHWATRRAGGCCRVGGGRQLRSMAAAVSKNELTRNVCGQTNSLCERCECLPPPPPPFVVAVAHATLLRLGKMPRRDLTLPTTAVCVSVKATGKRRTAGK